MSTSRLRLKFEVPGTITNDDGDSPIVYQVGKYLGKGGYAKCHQVTRLDTGDLYCAKMILKASLRTKNQKLFLEGEIDIHRKMEHPNIVRFIETFETRTDEGADLIVIILELCSGGSLAQLLKRKRRFTMDKIREYLKQILTALNYIHGQGVIHRDIKLGNVLVSKSGLKICDFGMATYIVDSNKNMCGTPNYISPEVLSGGDQTIAVDVWSLGITLYTMAVGRAPFETSDVKTTYRRIKDIIYYFPDSGHLSPAIKDLIKNILKKDPSVRPTLVQISNHDFMRIVGSDPRTNNKTYLIDTIYHHLINPINHSGGDPPLPTIWITGCKISKKYGLLYTVSNGEFGICYNDDSSMITMPPDDIQYVSYIPFKNKRAKQTKILSPEGNYNRDTSKKMTILQHSIKYPRHTIIAPSPDEISDMAEITTVRKWAATSNAIFFRLNNGTIQVSFNNGVGFIVSERGNVMTHIDKDHRIKTYWTVDIPESLDDQIEYIRGMLKHWIDQRSNKPEQK